LAVGHPPGGPFGNAEANSLGIVEGQVVVAAAFAKVPVVGLGTQLLVPVAPVAPAAVLEPDAEAAVKGLTLFPPLALAKFQMKAEASLVPCCEIVADVSSEFNAPPEDWNACIQFPDDEVKSMDPPDQL